MEQTHKGPTDAASLEIVPILNGYMAEAKQAREGGLNPRDLKWSENLDLYWNRFDHSGKAEWQASESLPEIPAFVDRFAAALKEALVAGPSGFYTVHDPADNEGDVTGAIKRMTDVWLSTCGRNQTGTCLGFPSVFEEQVKLGAIMMCSSAVVWKHEGQYGRVAIETVDPRHVWLDPTYRNLYRIRRLEIDKHELRAMARQQDKKGRSLYNLDAIEMLVTHIALDAVRQREELTGHGGETQSNRQTITLDEYIATVVAPDGRVLAENALMVVANDQFLIRGPEKNPFWHGKDWLVSAPLVHTPLSVYGRSYMEDFGSLAKTFNNLTNLILDAVQVSSMKAFVAVPSMLADPGQLASGITPNKIFHLEEGFRAEDFLKTLDLGALGPESIQIWQAIKNELREAADINEIGLGQFAPKGRTSATEITNTQESSSALIRSVAQTIEGRYLQPTLDLIWKTGLQHASPQDAMLRSAAGERMYAALIARRKELITRPVTFQARGISTMIQKGKTMRALLQTMQFLSQSPELLATFMKEVDMGKFVKLLFQLSDVDISKVTISDRERMVRETAERMQASAQQAMGQAGAPAAQPQGGGVQAEMQQLAAQMGATR